MKTMKIGFIGAGKVGFTLGKYFKEHENGLNVTGYYSRNPESAKEAAEFTGTNCYDSIEQLAKESDIIFLTVPDNTIKAVWDILKAIPIPTLIQDKIICHCSGALSSKIFDGIENENCQAHGYSFHPFFAVSSKYESYKEISRACFTLEGSEKYLQQLKKLFEQLGNPAYIIDEKQKTEYHAAAVFLSNHVIALAHTSEKMLKKCGFDDEFIQTAFQTLFLGNCEKIAANGTVNALTGPVERNDLSTIRKHLECLAHPERKLYAQLSVQLIEIAKMKHQENDYSDMENLLNRDFP
jgi:predicted short-subunit dehydrogenase-like oxidoreductase (DUF2520 family)